MSELPGELPRELLDRTAVLLRGALLRAESAGAAALAGIGVSGREYGILELIRHDGGRQSQRGLAVALGIDRTTTMKLVTALERRGFVVRRVDPADRRSYRLRLTARGEAVASAASRALGECDDDFTQGRLTDAEVSVLHQLLRRLL